MNSRRAGVLFAIAAIITVAAALGIAREWPKTTALRVELELARGEVAELAALRSENHRLREKQISTTELATLRADHAALPRLRAELEALNRSAAAEPR